MPDNLVGNVTFHSPRSISFLMARHGRGINLAMADGSARWVQLEELYLMSWQDGWNKYRPHLPP
jgi:prepilin-type processing-associated H-X9-DG protein